MSSDVEKLHGALYDKKEEDIILDITLNNDSQKRIDIAKKYKDKYKTSLFEDIKSKMKGDFGNMASQLYLSPLEFCIYHLKEGLKKANECPMEMLANRTPDELKTIEDAYKKDTGKDLQSAITKSFSGAIGKDLVNLFKNKRTSNPKPKKEDCEKYAKKLADSDPKKWTEDENLFKEIFILRSPEELILIARYYLKITGDNLMDVVEKKTKSKNQSLLKEILYNNIIPHELFAEKIYSAIKGLGTDEETLIRSLISRSDLDIEAVKKIYQDKYDQEMKEDIIGDTSGAFQKLCLHLIQE